MIERRDEMNNVVRMSMENEIMNGGGQKETSFGGGEGPPRIEATQSPYIYNIIFLGTGTFI